MASCGKYKVILDPHNCNRVLIVKPSMGSGDACGGDEYTVVASFNRFTITFCNYNVCDNPDEFIIKAVDPLRPPCMASDVVNYWDFTGPSQFSEILGISVNKNMDLDSFAGLVKAIACCCTDIVGPPGSLADVSC